ncbi:hypothetical protein HDU96_004793, partial [Phlyctochytrium bullatum]
MPPSEPVEAKDDSTAILRDFLASCQTAGVTLTTGSETEKAPADLDLTTLNVTELNQILTQLLRAPLTRLRDGRSDAEDWAWELKKDKIGTNSTVYLATGTSSTGETASVVIKQAVNKYSKDAILREQTNLGELYALAGSRGEGTVQVAKPLGSFHIPGSPESAAVFQVASLLPGMNGLDAMLSCTTDENRISLVKAFAKALQEFHSWTPANIPLLRCQGLPKSQAATPRRWFHTACHTEYYPEIVPKAETTLTTSSDPDAVEAATTALSQLKILDRVLPLGPDDAFWAAHPALALVHGDKVIQNVMFEKTNGEWRAVAIVDCGDVGYGDR